MIYEVRTQAELDAVVLKLGAGNCVRCVGDGSFVLRDNSHAELRDNSHAVLRDNSHAELRDNSHAVLRDNSHAALWGNSYADLRDNSHAELRDNSHAELRENSHAVLRDNSHAELWGNSHADLRDNSHAELWENSHAELWENSHAELWENSHAELRDNSHAVLRDNSHAVLRDNSHADAFQASSLTVRGNATAAASLLVVAHLYGMHVTVVGGVQIKVPEIRTAEQWCEWYGATVSDGVAILYKAVDDKYVSSHGFTYIPGTQPTAPDWDGGKAECGGGLHFTAHPALALRFKPAATRFVACPVLVSDIVVHAGAEYSEKIKAPGCCAPVWECDRSGKKIEVK